MRFYSAVAMAFLVASAAGVGPAVPQDSRLQGKPAKTENWKWKDPFPRPELLSTFAVACGAEKTFHALEFQLDDMRVLPPLGLSAFFDALKLTFSGREYPGGWDGIDPHGYDRPLLMMEYAEVPLKVRQWVEKQESNGEAGKGLFAIYDKAVGPHARAEGALQFPKTGVTSEMRQLDSRRVMIFAPGALHEILPLWLAGEAECKEILSDLSRYSPTLSDGAVVGWITSHYKVARDEGRDANFTIKVQVLRALKRDADGSKESSSSITSKTTKDEL